MHEETKREHGPPVIGDIYLMKFEGSGNEQNGWRPGVVFQNNVGNAFSPNIIALPLTSAIKKLNQPTHVILHAENTGLHRDSMVLCENPEKMSKSKLGMYITHLSDEYMKQIACAHLMAISAISFLSQEELLYVWQKSLQFNCIA